jgi:hypothetical protein
MSHRLLISALLLACVAGGAAFAADPGAASPPATPQDPAKQAILQSQAWRDAMIGYNEWLSVQVLYDKNEILRLKAQLKDKVAKMSADQLQAFLVDLQAKLTILKSKEAMDARALIEETFNVLNDRMVAKYRAQIPDIANMTAAQLQQSLDNFQQRHAQFIARRQAFDQQSAAEVAADVAARKATAEATERAQDRAAYSPANYSGGYYAPQRIYRDPSWWGGMGAWQW